MEARDPFEDFCTLQKELKAYRPDLLEKPFLVALNKMDEELAPLQAEEFIKRYPYPKETLFPISAMNQQGLIPLINAMRSLHENVSQRKARPDQNTFFAVPAQN